MFIDMKGLRVFVYQDPIDMRAGFERLSHFVRDRMKGNINQGHLYLFLGKNRRRAKCLFYDGTGLCMVAKRIERGRFMARCELDERVEITTVELKQIFNGGVVVKPRVERSFVDEKTSFFPTGIIQKINHEREPQQPNFPSHP